MVDLESQFRLPGVNVQFVNGDFSSGVATAGNGTFKIENVPLGRHQIRFTFIGKNNDFIFGNEYVKGAFDMTNRYMAGDWRQYYLDVQDNTINNASIELSLKNENTNFSAFVLDPQGKIISTNIPTRVFGHFKNWASLELSHIHI